MGFLERLRQEKEAKEAHEAAVREVRQRQEEAVRLAREQEEAGRRELSKLREPQARTFYKESGVGPMVAEFIGLIQEWSSVDSFTDDFAPYKKSIPRYKYNILHNPGGDFGRADPDSVLNAISWDRRHVGFKKSKLWDRISQEKYIAIEVCPDGKVVFHAGLFGSTTISEDKWRNNRDILEHALEKAWRSPRTRTIREWLASVDLYGGGH